MISLNYRDSRPIYEQIKDGLRKLIVTGAISADEKLPSVRSLATQLSINPNTIQRAYNELEGEGYIYSVPGKGSFATGETGAGASRRRELWEKARELLASTNMKVAEVAQAVGIRNTRYFSACFKKEVGQSPNDYREAHRTRPGTRSD